MVYPYPKCTTSTVDSLKYAHPRKYTHPPFLLKVIAKGHLLLEIMPTQQTKTICSSMHNDECVVYVWANYTLYCVCVITSNTLKEQQLKRMQSGSSSQSGQSGSSSVWPRETRACQRHYRTRRVRVWGWARLTQLLQLLHCEELQVPDCSCRQTKGCHGSRHEWGASSKRASYL